jgi:hypothetical protein
MTRPSSCLTNLLADFKNGNDPLKDVEFTLCERDENGSVIDVRYRGSYRLD